MRYVVLAIKWTAMAWFCVLAACWTLFVVWVVCGLAFAIPIVTFKVLTN